MYMNLCFNFQTSVWAN